MMEMQNEMRIMFLSKSENESFCRVSTAAFLSQLDPVVSELVDIKTAVTEAVSNSIIHGYGNSYGVITVNMRVYSDRTVEISVEDKGNGIEDIERARTPLFTTRQDEERAGMGFTVMETFMDDVKVESVPGEGTTVTMKKMLSPVGFDT